ncbi:hypothetical protein ACLQ2C_36620 [Streptomyces sp. DT73]|uniref:hypothetical protein n=1 Tax=Streptomyces sp. DT73 TaxID=3393420 RepID=UPI003CE9E3A5
MSTPDTDAGVDRALAYPEPPASPLYRRRTLNRPLREEEQRRNRELLLLALRRPRATAA